MFSSKKNQYVFDFPKEANNVIAQDDRALGIKHQNSFKNIVFKIDMNVLRIQGLILRTNKAKNWQKYSKKKCNLG